MSGEVIAVVAPGVEARFVASTGTVSEQKRLVHFGGQRLGVGAGGSGDDGDRHAGLFGVCCGKRLPGGIRLGLKVEVVHFADSRGGIGGRSFGGGGFRRGGGGLRGGGRSSGGACKARKRHHGNQNQSK